MRNPFDKSENELRLKFEKLEKEHAELRNSSEQMRQQLEELQKENAKLRNTSDVQRSKIEEPEKKVNEMATEAATTPAPQPECEQGNSEPTPMPKDETQSDGERDCMTDVLMEKLVHLEKLIAKEINNTSSLAGVMEKRLADRSVQYEKLLQNVQEDRYRKDKAKLINKLIYFVDLQRRMLYDFDVHRPNDEVGFLRLQIENMIVAMDDALRHEMVTTMPMASEGDPLNEETMDVVDTVETDNPMLDSKIFRSISACYIWTLPYILKARVDENGDEVRNFKFVLHPEEVIVYKLKKK